MSGPTRGLGSGTGSGWPSDQRKDQGRQRGGYGDNEEEEDTEMGGMDIENAVPSESMHNPPLPMMTGALPAPPNIAGLPAPNQPNTLILVPRRANGKIDRRLLNDDQSMWWNAFGQQQTNPSSDSCHQCVTRHTRCDLTTTSYPCTRCRQKQLACRNGLPTRAWEVERIETVTGVMLDSEREAAAMRGKGRGRGRGRGRGPRAGRGPPREGGRSASPVREEDDEEDEGSRQPPRSSRRRHASPARDEDDEEEDNKTPPTAPGIIRTHPRDQRPRNRTPYVRANDSRGPPIQKTISDADYTRKFGMERKCYQCTRQRKRCEGGKPCARCRHVGRECTKLDGVPYAAYPPLADDDDDDDEEDGEGGGGDHVHPARRPARRRAAAAPRARRKGKQRARSSPEADAGAENNNNNNSNNMNQNDRITNRFNGIYNPYHHLRRDMQNTIYGVTRADRILPLAAPIPPWWHMLRTNRLAQQRSSHHIIETTLANLVQQQRPQPGMGFDARPESSNRAAWDRRGAQETWYSNTARGQDAEPLAVRPEPVPYTVHRPVHQQPSFGQNMQHVGDEGISTRVPNPPVEGDEVPWIATWNYGADRLVQTRGPLGWPYDCIDSLGPGHDFINDGLAEARDCCEDVNHFKRGRMGGFHEHEPLQCGMNPSLQCEALPRYDAQHLTNPWQTCPSCQQAQTAYHANNSHETLLKQKLYVCAACSFRVRAEGRSWPKECLCFASKSYSNLCHLHRAQVENAAVGPIAIAEDFLIRADILRAKMDMCINCGVEEANHYSNVWSCKLCREWVQDTSEPWADMKR